MGDTVAAAAERDLLSRAAGGDQDAFEGLFHRFERPLYAYFMRMLQDGPTAEELVCDTMAAVWKGARSYRAEAAVSTWVFGIAHRMALGALRRRRPTAPLDDAMSIPADTGPEESAEASDRAARIRLAVASLPAEHREVVELTFFHAFSYPEIAKILNIPVNTVKTRMFYARQKLRPVLERAGLSDA